MADKDMIHEGDFSGTWVLNPGGTNEIGGKVIRGSLKEEVKQVGVVIPERNESGGSEHVRRNKMNEADEIVGGDVQIVNCMSCEYRLVDPKSVLVKAGMNNEVVIVSDDPGGIEVIREAGLNNEISYEDHAGNDVEKKKISAKPNIDNKAEIDGRPVLDEKTLSMKLGSSISSGSVISEWGLGKVEGDWYLLTDASGKPVMRKGRYVYQRK